MKKVAVPTQYFDKCYAKMFYHQNLRFSYSGQGSASSFLILCTLFWCQVLFVLTFLYCLVSNPKKMRKWENEFQIHFIYTNREGNDDAPNWLNTFVFCSARSSLWFCRYACFNPDSDLSIYDIIFYLVPCACNKFQSPLQKCKFLCLPDISYNLCSQMLWYKFPLGMFHLCFLPTRTHMSPTYVIDLYRKLISLIWQVLLGGLWGKVRWMDFW